MTLFGSPERFIVAILLCIGEVQDAGTPFGIQNAEFAEVIAADEDRAAFAFPGTPRAGDTQSADLGGAWHLYVSFTQPMTRRLIRFNVRLRQRNAVQVGQRERGVR